MGLYCFGQKLGLRACLRGHWDIGIKRLLLPVNYWRYPVFKYAEQFFPSDRPLKVLDIGSPKIFSLYLALRGAHDVYATDLQDEAIYAMWKQYYDDAQNGETDGRYVAEYQDARRLTYPDAEFDVVYSISVLEHIPEGGDSEAAREIGRVLKPGGLAIVEVPYAHQAFDTFTEGDVYERKFESAPVFYQRHYDERTLRTRLIEPSGLHLREKVVLRERWPFEKLYQKLPFAGRVPLFPLEALISRLNHRRVSEQELSQDGERQSERAMDVTLILQKPQGGG